MDENADGSLAIFEPPVTGGNHLGGRAEPG